MADVVKETETYDIITYDYETWRGKEINSLEYYGAIFFLRNFINNYLGYEDDYDDVYENTSSIRDGNRIDIHDNYSLNLDDMELEISFVYVVNGLVYAAVYDSENDTWYGEIELNYL